MDCRQNCIKDKLKKVSHNCCTNSGNLLYHSMYNVADLFYVQSNFSELPNLGSKYEQLVEIPILALLGKAIVIICQVLVENKKKHC